MSNCSAIVTVIILPQLGTLKHERSSKSTMFAHDGTHSALGSALSPSFQS
jgi:hypothetical protein